MISANLLCYGLTFFFFKEMVHIGNYNSICVCRLVSLVSLKVYLRKYSVNSNEIKEIERKEFGRK